MTEKPYARYDTRTLRYLRTQDVGVITDTIVTLTRFCPLVLLI